jgi:hypothetical protein
MRCHAMRRLVVAAALAAGAVGSLACTGTAPRPAAAKPNAKVAAEAPVAASYEEEVARAKAEHALAVKQYKAIVDAHALAMADFRRAKVEHAAAKKLAEAFPPPKASPALIEVYRRKQQKVADLYPDTQAAADAKILLADGAVKRRKPGPPPVEPAPPGPAPELVLPPVPHVPSN